MKFKPALVLSLVLFSAIAVFKGQPALAATPSVTSKPVCLENLCLFDPISKVQDTLDKKLLANSEFRSAPVCGLSYVSEEIKRKDGSTLTLGFSATPSSKSGEQYLLKRVKITSPGSYPDAQVRDLAKTLRERFGLVENTVMAIRNQYIAHQSKQSIFGITLGVSSLFGSLSVEIDYTPEDDGPSANRLRSQPGCASNVPKY